ncbi:CRISPR-associated protein Cas5 [Intrasporangium mesophilum]
MGRRRRSRERSSAPRPPPSTLLGLVNPG